VEDLWNLRKILAQNIKKNRSLLHISQTKLAEYADISFSYLTDIERCKTWVSDKTLANIARALNVPPHELLIPPKNEKTGDGGQDGKTLKRTAELIKAKKSLLRKVSGEAMDDLLLEIVRIQGE
jgi:transcriptional regulator with XRE-family HTH domain